MAPMQIKDHLGAGNIYDLVLCDFYAKARRLLGADVTFPMLINVNGSPAEKMFGLEPKEVDIDAAVNNLINECKKYGISFDYVLRDDCNPLLQNIDADSRGALVNECPKCGLAFGTDPNIKHCKKCGNPTVYHMKNVLLKDISHAEMLQRIEYSSYFPASVKIRLQDFIHSLPARYQLLLEKQRSYTSNHNGIPLDPRFTAIMLLKQVVENEGSYDLLTCVSGDLVKKYVYYIFAYLDISPSNIVVHGLATGENNKKIRWQNEVDGLLNDLGVDKQELRTFFATNSPLKNITISAKSTRDNAIRMNKLKKKFMKIFDFELGHSMDDTLHEAIKLPLDLFSRSISSWRFAQALNNVENIVNASLYILENGELLSCQEFNYLKGLYSLYF